MIHFSKLRFKNFLSFGDQFTEFQLDAHNTTLITGENGAGKSTMLDALTFVLYNKPFRKINKPQLINSINGKDCLVEVEFKVGEREYMVRRGIKPNIFEIYEGGTLVDQNAANNDYQGHLEKNIMQMNVTAFTQIVILGKATYVPFMRLPVGDRRGVIEDLLGLKIFGTMNRVLKEKLKSLKAQSLEYDSSVTALEDKINVRQEYIQKIFLDKEQRLLDMKNEMDGYRSSITGAQRHVDQHSTDRDDLVEECDDLTAIRKSERKLSNYAHDFNSKIKALESDIEFFADNDVCPTCTQDITASFKSKHTQLKQDRIDKINEANDKLKSDIAGIRVQIESIETIQDQIHDHDLAIQKFQAQITEWNRHITKLTAQSSKLALVSADDEQAIVDALQIELDQVRTQRADLIETAGYYMNIAVMLKDDGIKTLIIQKYLPIFNQLINQYLSKMGFFVKFELDEEFNEMILSRHRDKFSYASFSEGQKLRIDLAILMTWREIAKLKNSLNTNLLIMDEVFDSSLDQEGVDSFMDLIPTLGDANIFVVSHTPDKLMDKFISHIGFTLTNNFSTVASE